MPLYSAPLVLLFDDDILKDALQLGVVYLTTEAIMSNAYSWGVGHLNRKRPYVYNPRESLARRTRRGSFNSFYGGHAAATASCTFFLAKVYTDYHPDMRGRLLLYTAALIPPTAVAMLRHRAGMHFPSDHIAGIIGGAFLGTIIPHLHKNREIKKRLKQETLLGPEAGFRCVIDLSQPAAVRYRPAG